MRRKKKKAATPKATREQYDQAILEVLANLKRGLGSRQKWETRRRFGACMW